MSMIQSVSLKILGFHPLGISGSFHVSIKPGGVPQLEIVNCDIKIWFE
jgi:hypothetical protein